MTTAIIVAGGRGERLPGDTPKQFRDLGGLPILEWSVTAFEAHPEIDRVIIVLPAEIVSAPPPWLAHRTLVPGGSTRAESVSRGVAAAGPDAHPILVHDAVRPFVSPELVSRVVASARTEPTVPTAPVTDTVKEIDPDGWVVRTPPRPTLRAAQTPQGFPGELLRRLFSETAPTADITDEGVLCERAGMRVRTVAGDPANLKVTGPDDLAYARWLVESGVIAGPSLP